MAENAKKSHFFRVFLEKIPLKSREAHKMEIVIDQYTTESTLVIGTSNILTSPDRAIRQHFFNRHWWNPKMAILACISMEVPVFQRPYSSGNTK